MFLKKVKIKNYRQLKNIELDMQDSLTVLAGPNNSGKTTINVNIKMYIFDHLRMYIFAILPLDRYIFSIDRIFP